jgi:ribulose 1,5-bisphosphate carboxylase large subunit-like protein
MNNLFKGISNINELKENYKKIVDGIDTIKNDDKINNIMYNQLKQKAWWLYTDYMSKCL